MTYPCSSSDFRDLVDAYTGAPMPVVMETTPRGVLFSAPDAVTPRRFYPSGEMALAALRGRTTCPYTGEPLRPVVDGSAVMFAGGFDPSRPRSRREFLRLARMRDGASPVSAGDGARVGAVREAPPMPLSREKAVTQEAVDAALELTNDAPGRKKRRHR